MGMSTVQYQTNFIVIVLEGASLYVLCNEQETKYTVLRFYQSKDILYRIGRGGL